MVRYFTFILLCIVALARPIAAQNYPTIDHLVHLIREVPQLPYTGAGVTPPFSDDSEFVCCHFAECAARYAHSRGISLYQFNYAISPKVAHVTMIAKVRSPIASMDLFAVLEPQHQDPRYNPLLTTFYLPKSDRYPTASELPWHVVSKLGIDMETTKKGEFAGFPLVYPLGENFSESNFFAIIDSLDGEFENISRYGLKGEALAEYRKLVPGYTPASPYETARRVRKRALEGGSMMVGSAVALRKTYTLGRATTTAIRTNLQINNNPLLRATAGRYIRWYERTLFEKAAIATPKVLAVLGGTAPAAAPIIAFGVPAWFFYDRYQQTQQREMELFNNPNQWRIYGYDEVVHVGRFQPTRRLTINKTLMSEAFRNMYGFWPIWSLKTEALPPRPQRITPLETIFRKLEQR